MNDKTKNLLIVVGGSVALYLVAKLFSVGQKAADAVAAGYNAAVDTTSDALFRMFGPADNWSGNNHIVTFPDGQRHQVPANSVNSQGVFVNSGDGVVYRGDGQTYQIKVNVSTGEMRAVPY